MLPTTLPLVLAALLTPPADEFDIDESEPGRVHVTAGDGLFTTLRFGEDRRLPALYPLHAPDGTPITRGFPFEELPNEARDHPHHQSFWFAHGSVNGHDFWHGAENRVSVKRSSGAVSGGTVVLGFEADWIAGEQHVCTESRSMIFTGHGDARFIDVTIELSSDEHDLVFGDTKEGSFALRVRPELRLKGDVAAGSIRNSEGDEDGACWGRRATWVEYSGLVDGAPQSVAIFAHPSGPNHPTWWHARDYGLFAANPFGKHDFEGGEPEPYTVPRGESLTLRYLVVLRSTEVDAERLAADYDGWLAVTDASDD